MKNLIWVIPQLSIVLCVAAQAQDLPANTDARAKSLGGAMFEQAKSEIEAKRDTRTAQQVADLGKHLVAKGLLKTRLKNRNVDWTTEVHPSLPRVRLRRQAKTNEPTQSPEEALAELRASQGKTDEATVSTRAEDVARALHDDAGFSADETFVPVSTGQQVIILFGSAGKPDEGLVRKYRRVYRRYVGGVPVMGRAGEFEIQFDSDGEVEEVEVPTDSYVLTGAALPKLAGGTALDHISKRVGFNARVTKLHQKLLRNGQDADVDELLCGYVDDQTKSKLDRGCVVRYHAGQVHEEVVSAE